MSLSYEVTEVGSMINKFDILIKNFKYHRSPRVAQEEQRRKTKRKLKKIK